MKLKIKTRIFFSGKPSALYDQTHPDWAPSQKLGEDKSAKETSQDLDIKTMKRFAK
jgi:hypothetical protein